MCPKHYGFLVLNMNTIEFFSIAFMISKTYLRLEGKVPPPAQLIFFKHEYYIFFLYSIHV